MSDSITRRQFCRNAAAGAAALTLGAPAWSSAASAKRPNILMLVAEDMGLQLGCYGDPYAHTPNLDALASQGVRFENGWVTHASCSPSRSSIFTGLFPHENGQMGLSHRGYRMHRGIPNLPGLLGQAGYRTGVVGKVHVGPHDAVTFDAHPRVKNDSVTKVAGACRDFFAAEKEKPFFLSVNFLDTHRPFKNQVEGAPANPLTPDKVGIFPFHAPEADTPEIRKVMAAYYNGVQRVDEQVGAILKELQTAGLDDNTIVVYIGDHGPPFARGKLTCYESGLGIPYIVRWPGVARQGAVSKALVSTVDFLPTYLEAAGVEAPVPCSGRSLVPVLKSDSAPWRTEMFGEYTSHGPTTIYPRRAVRDARYKLIHNFTPDLDNPTSGVDGCEVWKLVKNDKVPKDSELYRLLMQMNKPTEIEFYDLEADPYEKNNLAGQAAVATHQKRLEEKLDAWMAATGDFAHKPEALERMINYHDANEQRVRALAKEEKDPKKRRALYVIDMGPFQRDWKDVVKEVYRSGS